MGLLADRRRGGFLVAEKDPAVHQGAWVAKQHREVFCGAHLILLCEEHHHIVDAQPRFYTVARLLRFKRDHEGRIGAALERSMEQPLWEWLCKSGDAPTLAKFASVKEFEAVPASFSSTAPISSISSSNRFAWTRNTG